MVPRLHSVFSEAIWSLDSVLRGYMVPRLHSEAIWGTSFVAILGATHVFPLSVKEQRKAAQLVVVLLGLYSIFKG